MLNFHDYHAFLCVILPTIMRYIFHILYWYLFSFRKKDGLSRDRLYSEYSISDYFNFKSSAAFTSPLNRGCAFVGRDLNSGWNWQPTNQG